MATRDELFATLRRAPNDQGARMHLWQLLCVEGAWDKAAAQLRSLAQLSPDAQMLATVYGRAIAAEQARAAALAGDAPIPIHGPAAPWTEALVAALTAFGQGRTADGEAARDAAFADAPDTPGEVDGEAFGWVADADARFGPTLEAIVNGTWGLMPFAALERIAFEEVRDLRDLVWRPAQCRFRSGASVAVLLPTRYPGSEAGDEAVRAARETRWDAGPAGERGLGQRLLAFDTRDDAGLLDVKLLVFG